MRFKMVSFFVRFITCLSCKQKNQAKYKIVMQEFCDQFNQMSFKLKKQGSGEVITRTAGQISLDKKLINSLSQEDVCSISYIAGYESALEGLEDGE